MSVSSQADVLIVGAGPTGLTAAIELLRRGISCRIIEKRAQPATTSRALSLHARTLELCLSMGIYDEIRSRSLTVDGLAFYADGRRLGQLDFSLAKEETQVETILLLSQAEIEHVLRERVAALGASIEFGVELVGLAQEPGSVLVTLSLPDGTREESSFAYLIGCDGGHSFVRNALQIAFQGEPSSSLLVADAEIDWPQDMPAADMRSRVRMCLFSESMVMIFPFPGSNVYRLVDTDSLEGLDDTAVALSFSKKISQALSRPITVHDPVWLSRFTVQQRAAAKLREGRCFIAGDAAHVHSPAGGQGLNAGMQDAYNLAWKLAMVLQKTGRELLLDSYNSERHPVAEELLQLTGSTMRRARSFRLLHRGGDSVFRLAMQLRPLQRFLSARSFRQMSGLALHYSHSPVLSEDWIGPRQVLQREGMKGLQIVATQLLEETMTPGLAPGDRVPDFSITLLTDAAELQPLRLLTLLCRSTNYTLLIFSGRYASDEIYRAQYDVAVNMQRLYPTSIDCVLVTPSRIVAQQFAGMEAIILDPRLDLHRKFGLSDNGLYLIRPDGYVGYRNQPTFPSALLRYLERVCIPSPEPV